MTIDFDELLRGVYLVYMENKLGQQLEYVETVRVTEELATIIDRQTESMRQNMPGVSISRGDAIRSMLYIAASSSR
jgi:hypothetical protein